MQKSGEPLRSSPDFSGRFVSQSLQEDGHEHRQEGCSLVFCEVFGVDEIAVADAVREFLAEGIERGMGFVA